MLPSLVKLPLYLIAALRASRSTFPYSASNSFFSTDSASNNPPYELTRLHGILQGCDYEHWLVFMEPPMDYPSRDELIDRYVNTLAVALGSEEEAKKSIYSVSTKYYYAFGCIVPQNLIYKIKPLQDVRWVLPDSYLCYGENGYGGEPFIDGKVAPYDDKYHKDWVRNLNPIGGKCITTTPAKKSSQGDRNKNSSVNSSDQHDVSQ